jgi:hypothetical protein
MSPSKSFEVHANMHRPLQNSRPGEIIKIGHSLTPLDTKIKRLDSIHFTCRTNGHKTLIIHYCSGMD